MLIFALDQFTKHIIVARLRPGESTEVIPHFLWWTFVQNTRGAFNLFGDHTPVLVVLSVLVLGAFWYAFRDLARRSAIVRLALGALFGGAVANMVDRVHYHYVVDFVDFRAIWQWVFNVADSAITLGVLVLIIETWRMRHRGGPPLAS